MIWAHPGRYCANEGVMGVTADRAWRWLAAALVETTLAAFRLACTCPDRDLWPAEDKGGRQMAAKLCRGCPVIRQRGHAADATDELWHVRGGIDRTARTRDFYRRRAA
jgi:hypothetical protein